jgi:hypothetical protein
MDGRDFGYLALLLAIVENLTPAKAMKKFVSRTNIEI